VADCGEFADQPGVGGAGAECAESGVRSDAAVGEGCGAGAEPVEVLLRGFVGVAVVAEIGYAFAAGPLGDVDEVDGRGPVAVFRLAVGHLLVEGGQCGLGVGAGEAGGGQVGVPGEDVGAADGALVAGGGEAEECGDVFEGDHWASW
jgi:hypothetical protein